MTEHLDFIVIGAGLSGIGAAHHIQAECPWADYAILEGRDAIGGTWDLFRYPGLRSDSDMFTLGYPFRPWHGEKSIADGDSILQYIRDTAADDGSDAKIRFNHRVRSASWSTDEARWTVRAERTDTGETVELTASFLYACSGYYRYDRGYTPDFPGRDDFGGQIIHPQFWPENLDYTDKKVVVIGSGATAVTLIPSLTDRAEHVTMLQRSPTYIAPVPSKDPIANTIRSILPTRLSGPTIKWMKALGTQASYFLSKKRPNLVRGAIRKMVVRSLPEGYDVDTHFNPSYDPWDQRLCADADGGLFAAIRDGSASVVTDHIERFDETGIRLVSGERLDADIIITATGLELLFLGGVEVDVDGEPLIISERTVYKGMMLDGVPNLAIAIGYANASWTLKADLISREVVRIANHLRSRGLRQATPVPATGSQTDDAIFGLTSGYIQRSAHLLPKQGRSFPWRVYQSYLQDYLALRRSPVENESMRFSNPIPRDATVGPRS